MCDSIKCIVSGLKSNNSYNNGARNDAFIYIKCKCIGLNIENIHMRQPPWNIELFMQQNLYTILPSKLPKSPIYIPNGECIINKTWSR